MIKHISKKQHLVKRIFPQNSYRMYYTKIVSLLKEHPLTSFFLVLFLLFVVIFLGNILSRPKSQPQSANPVKKVQVYTIGEAPTVSFQAKVDNPGVIKIVALSSGIIQNIAVSEGDFTTRGQQLFSLSTNYQGGNAASVQAQIADAQYANILSTFDQQKSVIQQQRDIANGTHDNFSDMQSIATQSASDTSNLITANQVILDQLNQQLVQSQNANASPSALIPQEVQINQLQAGQTQLKQTLANLQEQTNSSKPPGTLADIQRNLTMRQLDIQAKSLELNREVTKLQADIADINAAAMFPVSPFAGTVEKIYVRIGQQVSPGTPLAELSATDPHASVIVLVPEAIARNISPVDSNTLYAGGQSYSVRPAFISTQATDGPLFSIVYPIPDTLTTKVSDGEYMTIDIPVGHTDTSAAVPFIPLDAIYQTQDSNYLLIDHGGHAAVRQIAVGQIYGSYAEITQGLQSGDLVILDRTVIAGDRITH